MKAPLMGKNEYLDKILSDSSFRLLFTSSLSGGWNFIYSVFNICLAVAYRSYWFLTLGVYYFFLGCMRVSIVAHGKGHKDARTAESVVRHVGIALASISLAFCGTVVLSIIEGHSTAYGTIVMITIAAYTFYLLIMAIINSVKVRKNGDIKMVALRNISLGGVAVSMFSLEKSMMATFGQDAGNFAFLLEAVSGAVIFAILIALGVNLIVISKRN